MASFELLRNDPNTRRVARGETIFSEGEPGDCAFVVTEGEIDLSIHAKHIETIGVGGMFGEMILVDHKVRSATAKAKTDAEIVPVDQRRFLYLVQNTPYFAIEVMNVMAERLRRMDEAI